MATTKENQTVRRRFGIRHSLPFAKNIGVIAKTWSPAAAKSADELADKMIDGAAGLIMLSGVQGLASNTAGPGGWVSFGGFTLFYEEA